MKRLVLAAALAAGAVGCEPEINQDPVPDQAVVQFDPSAVPAVVPSPNDLAIDRTTGKVNAPIDPNSSPAQQEFTRDYINTLNGFPVTAGASASVSAPLDPTSVTPATVRLLPLNAVAVAALTPGADGGSAAVTPVLGYDATTNRVTVTPNPAWPKGSRWAVAIIGGESGVQSADGRPVVSSSTWALLQSSEPLVNCPAGANGQPNFESPDCTLGTNLIPSNVISSPEERFADQLASAKRLEQLRLSYGQVFAHPGLADVAREDVLLLWTWTTVSQPEATFDPAAGVVPFPHNLLMNSDNTRVALPVPPVVNLPDGGVDSSQRDLFTGLNTLDGFSTTGAIVSENGATRGALADGTLVAESLDAGTFFEKLSSTAAVQTEPQVTVCLNCQASAPPTATTPQQLQFVPQVPLDERTNYVAALTTDALGTLVLRDGSETGTEVTAPVMAPAAWALLRMANPIADSNGKSLVSGVPDANAAALEPNRARLKPLIDEAVAAGIPRSKMAIASVFRTMSTVTELKAIAAQASGAVPDQASYLFDASAVLPTLTTPHDQIASLFQGKFTTLNLLTGPGGTFNPNAAQARPQPVDFTLTIPTGTAPAGGWKVVIFGHGLSRSRNDLMPIANEFARAGYAAIAIDTVLHGERTTCVGSRTATGQASDVAACNNPGASACQSDPTSVSFGRCVAADPDTRLACDAPPGGLPGDVFCSTGALNGTGTNLGRCVVASAGSTSRVCEGSSFLPATASDPTPAISGWNILNTANLFATRDNFRQQVIDLTQLTQVIQATGPGSLAQRLGSVELDTGNINYVGQSLGGILGTLFTASSDELQRSVLNVPGGDPANILLTAQNPRLQAAAGAFLARLAQGGLTPGTPGFDQFISIAKWILDPADPRNYGYIAANRDVAGDHSVFIQYIEGDQTISNVTTQQLIAATNRTGGGKEAAVFRWPNASVPTADSRHGFLLNFANPTTTIGAQRQAVGFLDSGDQP